MKRLDPSTRILGGIFGGLLLFMGAMYGLFFGIDAVMTWYKPDRFYVERVENVARVFMHDRDEYTLAIRATDSPELIMRKYYVECWSGIRMIADVPPEQPMWVSVTWKEDWSRTFPVSLEIHIHSEKDLEGGKWERDKRSGTTTVVE